MTQCPLSRGEVYFTNLNCPCHTQQSCSLRQSSMSQGIWDFKATNTKLTARRIPSPIRWCITEKLGIFCFVPALDLLARLNVEASGRDLQLDLLGSCHTLMETYRLGKTSVGTGGNAYVFWCHVSICPKICGIWKLQR